MIRVNDLILLRAQPSSEPCQLDYTTEKPRAVWGFPEGNQIFFAPLSLYSLANRFGAGDSAAVLEAWQAPEPVRRRLFMLESDDPNLLDPAAKIGWPLAHGGVEPTHVLEAADLLRSRLQQTRSEDHAADFAGAYAAVAQRLQDPNAVKAAAEALRGKMEQASDEVRAAVFARAYAAVASQWLEIHRDNREWKMRITSRILAMAGQPFLGDATPLLVALKPLAGRTFGDDVGAAVAWWVEQYKGDPASLRPPLPSL